MLVCVFLHSFAHETAGAASARHSLRPLILGERFSQPRAHRAAGSWNCVQWKKIASETKHAVVLANEKVDCFASLAMTTPQFGTIRNKSRSFKSILQVSGDCA
jgi:hypothetical protein